MSPNVGNLRKNSEDGEVASWVELGLRISEILRFLFGNHHATTGPSIEIGVNDILIAVVGTVRKEKKLDFIRAACGAVGNQDPDIMLSPHVDSSVTPWGLGDSERKIRWVYTTDARGRGMKQTLVWIRQWLDGLRDEKKCHGLIYLEDTSMPTPLKPSRSVSALLEECVINQNIVFATVGWDDAEVDTNRLEKRDLELLLQWRPFVLRGATVLRLSSTPTSRGASSHADIVNLVIAKAGQPIRKKYQIGSGQIMLNPRDTDIVIPVMGPSGVGKSTFINYTIGQDLAPVGDLLESETIDVQPFVCPDPTDANRRVVLVDTPGFDDSKVDDLVILRRIADWLVQSYDQNITSIPIAGIIYLHDISQPRIYGTIRNNLTMFSKMIGKDVTKNVAIVTTKWGDSNHIILEERQKQLQDRHWKDITGATVFPFKNSWESGHDIVGHILNRPRPRPLFIQEEIAKGKKAVPDTQAGQAIQELRNSGTQKG